MKKIISSHTKNKIKCFFKKYFVNSKKEAIRRNLKNHFRWFFEGFSDSMDDSGWMVSPVVEMSINKFEITDMKVKVKSSKIDFHITLCRPGLLIGKGGRLIDQISTYLTEQCDRKVKIFIHESKIW